MSYITEEYKEELIEKTHTLLMPSELAPHHLSEQEIISDLIEEVAENVEQWVKEDDTWRRYQ